MSSLLSGIPVRDHWMLLHKSIRTHGVHLLLPVALWPVRMQRRRPRTSSPTRVSEIRAATAYEPKPQTIHITDNPAKNQSYQSSWPTTPSCRTHEMLDIALSTMAAISIAGKWTRYMGSLGGGRTSASVVSKERGLPHRWRTRNTCTGRGNTIRQE